MERETIIINHQNNVMQKNKKWMILPAVIVLAAGLVSGTIIWIHKQGPEKAPAFLPGVYTCTAQNEFYRVYDTLVIRRTQMAEDNYTITRATSFVRIRSGKNGAPEYEQQRWQATYLAEKRLVESI